MDPTAPGPRNVLGFRQFKSFGHPIENDPRPTTVKALIAQKDHYKRTLKRATDGVAALERAAEIVAQMDMRRPEEAILHCRREVFRCKYDGLPLCELEKVMASNSNPLVILAAYHMVKPAVEAQLKPLWEAALDEHHADLKAARQTP